MARWNYEIREPQRRIARPASYCRQADCQKARKVHNYSRQCTGQLTNKSFWICISISPSNTGRNRTVKFSRNDRNQHPRLSTLKSYIYVTAPCCKYPSIACAKQNCRDWRVTRLKLTWGLVVKFTCSITPRKTRALCSSEARLPVCQIWTFDDRWRRGRQFSKNQGATSKL
jgi:hypothetical protein